MQRRPTLLILVALLTGRCATPLTAAEPSAITHSYLVLGSKTAIIGEDGKVVWEHEGGSRDGFLLANGNVLIAYAKKVEEVTRDEKIVFSYVLNADNSEIGTTQRLASGRTLITELGAKPRLLEVAASGEVACEFPLQPETDNAHMQTRMARQLKNGNFLVPHLLAFAIKEYTPEGKIVDSIKTDLPSIGGRAAENWPFTAIRLADGRTLASLTHGNKIAEFDAAGEIVWLVTNEDVKGLFQDPCGAQRLANGNTVVGSHAASTGVAMVEVTQGKKIVWTSDHPYAANVHHFQILTTNGTPEPAPPMK